MPGPALCAQIYSLIITFLLLICTYADHSTRKPERLMRMLLLANAGLLACYISSWLLEGNAKYESLDYILTFGKCSLGFVLVCLYADYVFLIAAEQKPAPNWLVRAVRVACGAGLGLVFLSMRGLSGKQPRCLLRESFCAGSAEPSSAFFVNGRANLVPSARLQACGTTVRRW